MKGINYELGKIWRETDRADSSVLTGEKCTASGNRQPQTGENVSGTAGFVGSTGGNDECCQYENGDCGRGSAEQGNGNSPRKRGKVVRDTAELYAEYAEKIRQNERQSIENSQPARTVRQKRKGSTIEVTRDVFRMFKNKQTATFKEVQKYLYDSCNDLEREIISCTKSVKSAATAAKNTSKEISNSIKRLRHTHASLLLFAGVSIASVARRLGHASMTTTQKTYLHIIQELENKDIDLVMRSLSELT